MKVLFLFKERNKIKMDDPIELKVIKIWNLSVASNQIYFLNQNDFNLYQLKDTARQFKLGMNGLGENLYVDEEELLYIGVLNEINQEHDYNLAFIYLN